MTPDVAPSTSRPSRRRPHLAGEAAFTLVELMIVVAILAITAVIALPNLMRDDTDARFQRETRELAQLLVKARVEAISNRQNRAVEIAANGQSYSMGTIDPGVDGGTFALANRLLDERVRIEGVRTQACLPENPCAAPTTNLNLPARVRFLSTGESIAYTTATFSESASSTTIFIGVPNDNTKKARIVIFQSTGTVRIYDGW